ncbi:MAG TPA: hypothetical protein VHP83_00620 [Aggregatilineaceae bacterium]|nr:hypothetical protein [Aggregatilineaceae bacterium]
MAAIERLQQALIDLDIDEGIAAQIVDGTVRDKDNKKKRAAFFVQAISQMERLLDEETCHAVRDACACSKGGWRLKAVQKLAKEYAGRSLGEKIAALGQITHMGNPVLNEDGTITAGIGDEGGLDCPCPVFEGLDLREPVSLTYCYCCAGHFRFHYQIALGKSLVTKRVVSSALNSLGKQPCRFEYAIVE